MLLLMVMAEGELCSDRFLCFQALTLTFQAFVASGRRFDVKQRFNYLFINKITGVTHKKQLQKFFGPPTQTAPFLYPRPP
jgi:hypothetical protein